MLSYKRAQLQNYEVKFPIPSKATEGRLYDWVDLWLKNLTICKNLMIEVLEENYLIKELGVEKF